MTNLAPAELQKRIQQTCPYWHAPKCDCKVDTEGIFIPLDNHIEIYCESSEYTLCPHYTEHDVEKPVAGTNKRKRVRIDSTHPITIIHLNDSGNVASRETSKATTIDLSMSGMRLITDEPMLKNSLIQFSLDEMYKGIAISKWCSPSRDKEGYHVGLAFHNKETTKAMGTYFNSAIRREKIRA